LEATSHEPATELKLGVEVVLGSPALIDHRTWIESALATAAVENDADGL